MKTLLSSLILFLICAQSYSQCTTYNSFSVTACDSYTSPSGNYVWNGSNTYMDTIPNAALCDSVLTIDLTILEKPVVLFTADYVYGMGACHCTLILLTKVQLLDPVAL